MYRLSSPQWTIMSGCPQFAAPSLLPLSSLFSEYPFPLYRKETTQQKNCDTCPATAIVCLELLAQFNAFMAVRTRKEEAKRKKCVASCLNLSGFPNDSSSYKAAYVVLQTIVSPGVVAMVSVLSNAPSRACERCSSM